MITLAMSHPSVSREPGAARALVQCALRVARTTRGCRRPLLTAGLSADGQRGLDQVDDLRRVRHHLRAEAVHPAVRRHEELLEVPGDAAGLALLVGGLGELCVQRVPGPSVDLDRLE